MTVIKNTQAQRIITPNVVDLADLRRQAEQVLAEGCAEARRIVEESRAHAQELIAGDAQRGFEEGRQKGLAEGREEGERQGRQLAIEQFQGQIQQVLASWLGALERWEQERAGLLLAAREDVLRFALAMGAKITHRTIEADPSLVADQVAEALSLLTAPGAVTVSINPQDRPLVEMVLGELVAKLSRCAHLELREDPAVSRGGCVVTTGRGYIDATIERQIERIVEALLGGAPREDLKAACLPAPGDSGPSGESGPPAMAGSSPQLPRSSPQPPRSSSQPPPQEQGGRAQRRTAADARPRRTASGRAKKTRKPTPGS